MKRIIMLLVFCLALVGCQSTVKTEMKKVTVTTSFLHDMVKQLAKDEIVIDLIIPYGEDPHLYNARPNDLQKVKNADLLLYHGLHFEGKMIEVLEKKGISVTKDFSEKDYMMTDEKGNKFIDPHFWFDVNLYKNAVKSASQALINLLPEKKEFIQENTTKYLNELDSLNEEIKNKLNEVNKESRYLITPHDAFNYFSRAFNIEVLAPQGVSTDSEVSNYDLEATANFIVEHKIKAIFSESTTDPIRMKKLQDIVKSKKFNVKVVTGENQELYSDSLAKNQTYIEMMRHNIKLIVENLK